MKKTLLLSVMILIAATMMAQEQKEVVTGAGYANDVFYSLDGGIVDTMARESWDIAFAVPPLSLGVSILTNGGAGVELYTYSKADNSDWAGLDTTGMVWSAMYNSLETFEEGAFSAHASFHPDYGWGTYSTGGLITGDSLFIIKTMEGNYKKLEIIKRDAAQGMWEFKFANLDGSEEKLDTINTAAYTGNFIYYSIDTMEELDREPATADWDLLFTKYWDYTIPYSVTGIITNEHHVLAQEVKEEGLEQSTFVEFEDTAFTSVISVIGSDWKSFNMSTFSYDVDSTVVFFVKKYGETDSTYYKLYFTGFDYTIGQYTFMQEKLSLVSVDKPGIVQFLEAYPNPASDYLNVLFDHAGETVVQIIDMTGRIVYSTIHKAGGFTILTLDIDQLNPGLFFLKVNTGDETGVLRFLKN